MGSWNCENSETGVCWTKASREQISKQPQTHES